MNIQEAVKEIEKIIAHNVLMSVYREINRVGYDATDMQEILNNVADEYETELEI